MKKLLAGIKDFRTRILPGCRDKFAVLAKGQHPDVLFIACSDSRVAPNWFASTDPGDLFVVRNIGNLVPPAGPDGDLNLLDTSAMAAAEFSVHQLKIEHIVVCGHSECGAMHALASMKPVEKSPHLNSWLKHGLPALEKLNSGTTINPNLSRENQLSQLNVLEQLENLKSHSFIRKQIDAGKLQIHGWWFDIAKADVYRFSQDQKQFEIIQ